MNANYRFIHVWSKCRRVGYSLEPPKHLSAHISHTHTHTLRTPECIAKTTTTSTCKKQTKTNKTNANRSQNYKTKTNYIIKYLYTGILRGTDVSEKASVRPLCALRHLFRTTGYVVHGLRISIWLEQQQQGNAQIRNANEESKKKSQKRTLGKILNSKF